MSQQVMIDIETMDTAESAAILAIGACAFDMHDLDAPITNTFSCCISLESNAQAGRTMSASTIAWWLRQKPEAQAALQKPPIQNLRTALVELRMWVEALTPKATHVWAKDPDFDCVILKHAFKTINDRWPFEYWMGRSVRTIVELAYPDGDEPTIQHGVAHAADDDAIRQALMVRHCWHKLQFGKA